jgi:DNA-binding response OmpR family regulator
VRVLVIDDDAAIRSVLERGLGAEGFEVDSCADGPTGLWKAIEGSYKAVVLDLLLPGTSGYSVCEQLRAEGLTMPILVLTAKSGDLDQIDLLDAGADDFLTKPVAIAVLAARLRVLIRRGSSMAHNQIARGALTYDLGTRQCAVGQTPVVLTNREEQLLRHLLLAEGRCLRRDELLDDIWGVDSGVDPSILDIYVRRLRAKLQPCEVENVRGFGYRIVAH